MLAEDELQDCKLLVFANKQDQENAMTPAEVSEALGLHTLKGRQWTIMKSCAIKGEGLEEGLDWSVAIPPLDCHHSAAATCYCPVSFPFPPFESGQTCYSG